MILKNNAQRPIGIGTGSADTSVNHLKPGLNTLEQADWDKLKNHPVIKSMLAEKELEIIAEDVPGEPTKDLKELKDLSSKEAKELIELTFEIPQLKSWSESETRAPIKKAIETQIEKIEIELAEASKEPK